MSVIFQSTIKENKDGNWYIELKDTVDGRIEICQDLKEYEAKLNILAEEYNGQIDEVKWLRGENVSEGNIYEVQVEMAKIQEELNNDTND